jgi:ABC-2 type transport system ATP-binding protein
MSALRVDDLALRIDGREILSRMSFEAQAGELVALIGPNGSGKSSLLRCIAGIESRCTGRVAVGGIDLAADPLAARRALGYAVDPALLPRALTPRDALRLFAGVRGCDGIPAPTLALADALGLAPWLDELIDVCSLGTRQKVGVLLGLLGEPPLLLLDEPTNGLDPVSAHRLKRHLVARCREAGTCIVFATHALDAIERIADRVLVLVDGELAQRWDAPALAALRATPGASLEQALVEALARR